MRILLLFLRKELGDVRSNSRVWPVYLLLPLIAVALPVFFAVTTPLLIETAPARQDPATLTLIRLIQTVPEFAGLPAVQAMTRYFLRNTGAIFLLMPLALTSTSAAFSIVGEKQQRTLEPILATPITDRQFLLAKLLASVVPTVALTWSCGMLACVVVDAVTWAQVRALLLPDRFWLLGLLVLAPLLGIAVVLVTMLFSAKSTDPQATVQTTALAIIPGFLLVFGVFGKLLTLKFAALGIACLLVLALDVVLFRTNVARFQREEILTRWK